LWHLPTNVSMTWVQTKSKQSMQFRESDVILTHIISRTGSSGQVIRLSLTLFIPLTDIEPVITAPLPWEVLLPRNAMLTPSAASGWTPPSTPLRLEQIPQQLQRFGPRRKSSDLIVNWRPLDFNLDMA